MCTRRSGISVTKPVIREKLRMSLRKISNLASALLIAGCIVSALRRPISHCVRSRLAVTSTARLSSARTCSPTSSRPPEYIIEPYLEATLALDDPAAVTQHREGWPRCARTCDARHEYWIPQQFDDNLRALLVEGDTAPRSASGTLPRKPSCRRLKEGDLTTAREAYAEMRRPTAPTAPRSMRSCWAPYNPSLQLKRRPRRAIAG